MNGRQPPRDPVILRMRVQQPARHQNRFCSLVARKSHILTMRLGEIFLSNGFDHTIFASFGIIVSLYALLIEVKKHQDPTYRAACDISEHMSCSKVLTSKYSKGFGLVELLLGKDHFLNIPNCITGILFYSLQLVGGFIPSPVIIDLLYYASIVSLIGTVYLAFILFFILKDLCLVCLATYVVNFALLYLNYQRFIMTELAIQELET